MTGQKLHDCLSHRVWRGAQICKYLSAYAFTFTHQAKEYVLGADVVVMQLEGQRAGKVRGLSSLAE